MRRLDTNFEKSVDALLIFGEHLRRSSSAESFDELGDETGAFEWVVASFESIEGGQENQRFFIVDTLPDIAACGGVMEFSQGGDAVVAVDNFVLRDGRIVVEGRQGADDDGRISIGAPDVPHEFAE